MEDSTQPTMDEALAEEIGDKLIKGSLPKKSVAIVEGQVIDWQGARLRVVRIGANAIVLTPIGKHIKRQSTLKDGKKAKPMMLLERTD